ncbi:hypothetical protein LKO27_11375 [Tessaracoccus sp. OS52]|uniref:hypothetical protein n=1 Tax=Tessaracoccus sp. OS52 TaxID=2886691 RepID=UPI001D10D6EA|nr:hypothetical protein [Tessaracoccus sp. OS52]MCC2594006.1 hypothetical protein [Tessaracoccus sp. OS52]
MADWPVWVWVLIVVIALIIVIAIILGLRKKDHVDPDGPFAEEHHSHSPGEPRRGVEPDPSQDELSTDPESAPVGRRVDASSLDDDEETMHGPLVVPDDSVANDEDTAASAAGRYSEGYAPAAPADEPAADFAAGDGQQEPDRESEFNQNRQQAFDESDREPSLTTDHPEELDRESRLTTDLQEELDELDLEPELSEDPTAWGEPDVVAASEPLPANEASPEPASPAWSQDAVEDEDAEDEDVVEDSLPLDEPARTVRPQGSPEPPPYADREDYGSPVADSRADDDIPRDAQGRRLDPYGNPIDG